MAATHSRGIANAALSCAGQAIAVFLGSVVVVVVVVVVDVGTVVVVVPVVVVVTGTVVVVTVVVVEGAVLVVVVVVVVTGRHPLGTVVVVVVVDANAGPSCAEVAVEEVRITTKESAMVMSEQRRSQGIERRVTQRMYNASAATSDSVASFSVSPEFRTIPTGLGWH